MLNPRTAAPFVPAILLVGAAVFAQLSTAQSRYTSPPATASVQISGKKISVDYYAPSAHGRKVMGGLVPFGEVWCTGANYATKVTTDAPLRLGDLDLPKGEYSI